MGWSEKGDLNYVIFNEDDAKIVGNTKFSLKNVNDAFNQRLDELVKNPNQRIRFFAWVALVPS